MTPMKFWHTYYVTIPPIGSLYDCRIVAALPDTLVWYHCGTSGWQSVTLPNTGYDVLLQFGDAICKVFTTGPVMLTIIIHSVTHDPSMVVLQPLCEIHKTVAFHVPVSLESAQIMFVTYIDDLNYITLDNDYVTNLHITPIEPDLVGVFGYVQSGTHFIRTSGLSLRISGYVLGRHGSETYGFSLQAGRNSSFVFDTGTAEILNNNKYESTATPLTYDTEITTQVRDENNLEQSINSVTVDDTVSTASGTAKSVGTSESSSTETKGFSASGNLETSKATTVASGFTTSEITPDEIVSETTLTTIQKSETKIASGITAYEKPPEATMITAIITSGPNTETTASKVKAAPKPTTEATTTTFTETTESNIQTTTVKTARKTVAGTSQPVTKTTAAIFYGTSVAHGDTNLMASEGTTTAVTNEITSIDWNTSPESKRPTETSVLCGTANPYSIKNMKCFMYCRNYTRDMDIRLVDMRANLIDRKKTRRYIRTLTSAQDDRMSVQTIGYTGVICTGVSVFIYSLSGL
ncbi:uncharacterized protein LOC117331234 [Pecten maximus]|uniref:uncharacterized protein LOC117331234 n=1 Tax=Pecten maximus TaxID=6579 RepID=UPI00145855EB|nr:uncharacterized protein LOC117331234 [Pecten maximus]